jgi:flagellar biosynthesis/type III secretory pathway protein FliH
VEIHPRDRALIDASLNDVLSRDLAGASIRVLENSALERGDCLVRSNVTTVDLRCETQLDIARRRLIDSGGVQ